MNPFYQNTHQQIYATSCHQLSFPTHLHNAVECLYVVKGGIEIAIDNQSYSLSEGEIAVVFPNIVHSYSSDNAQNSTCLLFIYPIKSTSQLNQLIQGKVPLSPILSKEKIHSDIPNQLNEMIALCQQEKQQSILIDILVQLVLARLLDQLTLSPKQTAIHENIIEKAVTYITENFKSSLTLTDVATHLGLSKYHLSRVLKNALGMGFCSYINNLRIDYAKGLLASSNLFIVEVATESGYDSLRSFNRCFQEIVGCSPKEFRNRTKL